MIPQNLLNKFTSRAQEVMLVLDQRHGKKRSLMLADFLVTIHELHGSLGSNFLKAQGIKGQHITALKKKIVAGTRRGNKKQIEEAIKLAAVTATRLNQQLVGTQHLLYGVLMQARSNKVLRDFFKENKKSLEAIIGSIEEVLHMGSQFSDLYDPAAMDIEMGSPNGDTDFEEFFDDEEEEAAVIEEEARAQGQHGAHAGFGRRGKKQSVLDRFGTDLTTLARKKMLDPLIGRDEEVRRVVQVLNRRTKSNPVLVGDPGVGKTAIANGLAYKIVQGDVPSGLADRKLYVLKMTSVLSGTMFRGEFEAKLEAILDEVRRENIVLFIDEIHTIIGAGAAQGSLDAANILKPALAQGEIQVIGATTLDEYRGYIEKDKALERRFQPITVDEPDHDTTIKILKGLRYRYEDHHKLRIEDDAITAAVHLSARYIPDRFLPDKAIDLIDESASRLRSAYTLSKEFKLLQELKEKRHWLEDRKELEIDRASYDRAFQLKKEEEIVHRSMLDVEQSIAAKEAQVTLALTSEHIHEAVADMTKIPVAMLNSDERLKLGDLEKRLSNHIVGQGEAIGVISRAVRRARAGLSHANRPLGSYMFMGPSGVGKTELTKVLAREVFGKNNLIRIDMSEFAEPHAVARLLGAPAGYVGYGEGGQLTESIRRRPYSIVLFDEIEKAHPQIYNILLQMLEDGLLTDAMGRAVSFKHAIIVMTSNLGTQEFNEQVRIGFGEESDGNDRDGLLHAFDDIKRKALKELKEKMKPELINRLDEIIVFQPLDKKHISAILKNEIATLKKRLKVEQDITLSLSRAGYNLLARKSFVPQQGARPIRRILGSFIEDSIAQLMINEQVVSGDTVQFDVRDQELYPVVRTKKRTAMGAAVTK